MVLMTLAQGGMDTLPGPVALPIAKIRVDRCPTRRLSADLQSQGVRCWFAPQDLKVGDYISKRIDEAIRVYDKLLLILSQHSLESSWIEHEVEAVLEREQSRGSQVLFPIRLDASSFLLLTSFPDILPLMEREV
jgi:TIR domain